MVEGEIGALESIDDVVNREHLDLQGVVVDGGDHVCGQLADRVQQMQIEEVGESGIKGWDAEGDEALGGDAG